MVTPDPEVFSVPAAYVNLINVTGLDASTVRIAFAEGCPGVDPQWRFAVAMSIENARAVIELLQRVIASVATAQAQQSAGAARLN